MTHHSPGTVVQDWVPKVVLDCVPITICRWFELSGPWWPCPLCGLTKQQGHPIGSASSGGPVHRLLPFGRPRLLGLTPMHVGKTPPAFARTSRSIGSPPRAWGRPLPGGRRRSAMTVHPHARGEDVWHNQNIKRYGGSPPRTWGRRLRGPDLHLAPTVHPHPRGEDTDTRPVYCSGSGVTPTHVGKTKSIDS